MNDLKYMKKAAFYETPCTKVFIKKDIFSVRNELERGFEGLGQKCGNRTWNLFNPLMPAILKRMETCKTGCYC